MKQYNALLGQKVDKEKVAELLKEALLQEQSVLAEMLQKALEYAAENKVDSFELITPVAEQLGESLLSVVERLPEYINPEDLTALNASVTPDDIYTMITNNMMEYIKEATGRGYKRKWEAKEYGHGYTKPMNYISGKAYSGINLLLLKGKRLFDPIENPFYLTFKQIDKLGGKLRKGSKGKEVVYFTVLYKFGLVNESGSINLDFATYDKAKMRSYLQRHKSQIESIMPNANKFHNLVKQIPIIKYYNVFSAKDVEGVEFDFSKAERYKLSGEKPVHEGHPAAEAIIKNYPIPRPKLNHGGDKAYYAPMRHIIQVPHQADFASIQDYYRTLFHEYAHSTGHPEHLNRDFSGRFGSKKYANEELIAEFCSVFLSAEAGFVWRTNKNHAEYLRNWANVLKYAEDDNRFLFKAAAAAQRAAKHILQYDSEGNPAYFKDLEEIIAKAEKEKANEKKEVNKSELKSEINNEVKPSKTKWVQAFEKESEVSFNKVVEGVKEGFDDFAYLYPKTFLLAVYETKTKIPILDVGHVKEFNLDVDEMPYFTNRNVRTSKAPGNLKDIVGKDDLRPYINGVYADSTGYYVATDAHSLIAVPQDIKSSEADKIISLDKKAKHKFIEGNFPLWRNVVPEYGEVVAKDINIKQLYSRLSSIMSVFRLKKNIRDLILVEVGDNVYLGLSRLIDLLKAILANGVDSADISFKPNGALMFKAKNGLIALIMPFRYTGSKDYIVVNYPLFENTPGNNAPKRTKKKEKALAGQASLFGLTGTAENEDTVNFNKQILEAKRNGYSARQVFYLGESKDILKKYIGRKKITLSGKVIRKAMSKDKDHSMQWHNFINLPDFLNKPSAIFESATVKGSKVIVVNIKNHLEKPLMVALKVNDGIVSDIRSIYSRSSLSSYQKWIDSGLLLYINKKDEFYTLLQATIAIQCTNSSSLEDKYKNNKSNSKKGLSVSYPIQEINTPKASNLPNVRNILENSTQESEFFKIPGAVGEFLQQVEKKPRHSVVITMDGQQGAGKTTMLYKFIDSFASIKKPCVFFSLEEHPDSHLARQKAQEYISPENAAFVDAVGEVSSKEELYKIVDNYDFIFIDSWQKLTRAIGNIKLDEDLRMKFDGKVFVVIFQQTTTGRTKGGADIVFDGDIIIKLIKEARFSDNYAYMDKNRYAIKDIADILYNVAGDYTYSPHEVVENDVNDINVVDIENTANNKEVKLLYNFEVN